MKLRNLLLITTLFISVFSFAQEGEENRECLRMRKIANDAMSFENFQEATTYFLRGEQICGDDFGQDNYQRLVSCLIKLYNAEPDNDRKKLYADTLNGVYDRSEKAGHYDKSSDLKRAYFNILGSKPDYRKADSIFTQAFEMQGTKVQEFYVVMYYYNTFTLYYYIEKDEAKKAALKQRMIKDYFSLMKLCSEAGFSAKTQQQLGDYLNKAVQSCEDLTPEIPGFIENLPEDPAAKKDALMNMIQLMEDKECTEDPGYMSLIEEYLIVDPGSQDALLMKVKVLEAKGKYGEAISTLKEIQGLVEEGDQAEEIKYRIALNYFKSGQYQSAYNAGKAVGGKFRGDGLSIAGQSVGKTAMGCGDSTFERKCNYIYAVQLLEQAQANGATGLGGVIASYKGNYPTADECFNAGNPASQSLSCWGVSVQPCK